MEPTGTLPIVLSEEPFPFFKAVLTSQEEPRRSTGRSLELTNYPRAQRNSATFLIIPIEIKKKIPNFSFRV